MHGMVFGELKKFVDKQLGGDTWQTLLDAAQLPERVYTPIKAYPDTEIFAIINAAVDITGLEISAILKSFGEFIAPDLLLLFRKQIDQNWDVLDFLEHTESTIHNVVRLRNPGAKPPQLHVQRVSATQVSIRYTSPRRMCALGIGIITGIAQKYHAPVSIQEETCMLRGDSACTIHIKAQYAKNEARVFSEVDLDINDAAQTPMQALQTASSTAKPPVVIIGTGPVGIHAARQLLIKAPDQPLIIFGAEPWVPYNRVRLSEILAGDIELEEIANSLEISRDSNTTQIKINTPISAINKEQKYVTSAAGLSQPYSKLILAIGSRPRRADARAAINLLGVYTFRDIDDVYELMTNIVQSENTVVAGGGVLGVEVAFALKSQNPQAHITIVHKSGRLMNKQLEEQASNFLLSHVLDTGIKVFLNTGIEEFLGDNKLTAVRFDNGELYHCDTLISCAGIMPNAQLAEDAGLQTNRGIVVNDYLQTSDPDIYAIGECTEYCGHTIGLIGPGVEQATIAVNNILDGNRHEYKGSHYSMRGKVKNLPIFSLYSSGFDKRSARKLIYEDKDHSKYREILLDNRGHLVGATAIGDWPDFARVQEEMDRRMWVNPWLRYRFNRNGSFWPNSSLTNPATWSSNSVICTCSGITRGQLGQSIEQGCKTVAEIQMHTGAAQGCGTCLPFLEKMLNQDSEIQIPFRWGLLSCFLTLCVLLNALFLPALQLPDSIKRDGFLQQLIFDNFWQQVTGYTVVALGLFSLIFSLNKRLQLFQALKTLTWQTLHAAMICVAFIVLMLHSNFGWGVNFNFKLQVITLLTLVSGMGLAFMIMMERSFISALLRTTRFYWVRCHILLTWTLIGFLSLHIIAVYYF